MDTTVLVAAILFLSTFTRSALGFGNALVAMPLLVMTLGIRTATPLVAFVNLTTAVSILIGGWREVDLRAAWRLIAASFLGIPIGLWFLKGMPEHLVKAVLGVLLVAFGLYNLTVPHLPRLKRQGWAYVFGFVAGVLGGAYNTMGPPVVIYGALRRWPPERFRVTLQCYFFPVGLLILAGHGLAGLLTSDVFRLYGYSLLVVMLAIFLGGKFNSRIPSGRFDRLVHAFLIVIGVFLVF